MKIYHYCATYQNIDYIDGLFSSDIELIDEKFYKALKNHIGELMVTKRKSSEIVLLSLTVIG